jgi:hypothetical protein
MAIVGQDSVVTAQSKQKSKSKKQAPADAQTTEEPKDLGVAMVTAVGDVVSAAMWPLIAIGVFLALRRELLRLIRVLADKIADRGTSVGIGSLVVTAQQGDIEALRASFAQLRTVVDSLTNAGATAKGMPTASAPAVDPMDELKGLAAKYAGIQEPDKRERTRIKDALGMQMGSLVYVKKINRLDLARAREDAYSVALAYAAVLDPLPSDTELLIEAGATARSKHARYAIARALGRLASAQMIQQRERKLVEVTLEAMSQGDVDRSLISRIEQTKAILATQRS